MESRPTLTATSGSTTPSPITPVGYNSCYWEIRKSWGTGWGNQGYLKITRRVQDVCQIASNFWFLTTESQLELEE